jgi:hypothetical protein
MAPPEASSAVTFFDGAWALKTEEKWRRKKKWIQESGGGCGVLNTASGAPTLAGWPHTDERDRPVIVILLTRPVYELAVPHVRAYCQSVGCASRREIQTGYHVHYDVGRFWNRKFLYGE